jgi:hypothetical protein
MRLEQLQPLGAEYDRQVLREQDVREVERRIGVDDGLVIIEERTDRREGCARVARTRQRGDALDVVLRPIGVPDLLAQLVRVVRREGRTAEDSRAIPRADEVDRGVLEEDFDVGEVARDDDGCQAPVARLREEGALDANSRGGFLDLDSQALPIMVGSS